LVAGFGVLKLKWKIIMTHVSIMSYFRKPTFFSVTLLTTVFVSAQAASIQHFPHDRPGTPYSKAVRVGDMVYVAGQVGIGPDGLVKGFESQSKQVMDNIATVLKSAGLGMDDIVKCQVFMADISKLDDFGKIYVSYFKPGQLPARTSVGVAALPRGADMEVDCIANASAR
jgi:2-iminobutanoate/2-iminopropanoate deaminase